MIWDMVKVRGLEFRLLVMGKETGLGGLGLCLGLGSEFGERLSF